MVKCNRQEIQMGTAGQQSQTSWQHRPARGVLFMAKSRRVSPEIFFYCNRSKSRRRVSLANDILELLETCVSPGEAWQSPNPEGYRQRYYFIATAAKSRRRVSLANDILELLETCVSPGEMFFDCNLAVLRREQSKESSHVVLFFLSCF